MCGTGAVVLVVLADVGVDVEVGRPPGFFSLLDIVPEDIRPSLRAHVQGWAKAP